MKVDGKPTGVSGCPGWTGTSVILTGLSYLLSEPVALSTIQPIPPPRMMLPKIAPAAPEWLK